MRRRPASTRPRRLPPLRESSIQGQITDALWACGLQLWETTAWKQKGESGVDKGISDLLVSIPGRPAAICLEVKTATGAIRPEQAAALAERRIAIVRSPEDALRVVIAELATYRDAACLEATRKARNILAGLEGGR